MFLLIIISFQYYFLARLYKKNKLKTVLSVVGLYFLANIIFAVIVSFLVAAHVIHVDFDFNNPESTAIALNEYLNERNIPIILEISLFVLLGVVYYNYLKNKWTKELILENEPMIQSMKEAIAEIQTAPKVTSKFYCHFHKVNDKNVHWIPELAQEIWNDTYTEIISKEQIDYMLGMMYNEQAILDSVANGEHWEILKADNVPIGYVHFKEEDNKIFLSKIYLKQEEQYKGLGQVMMNHVIDFATNANKNSIYLTVNKDNKKAIRFYERNGFRNIKSEVFDIGEGYVMDDFIFEKTLNKKVELI